MSFELRTIKSRESFKILHRQNIDENKEHKTKQKKRHYDTIEEYNCCHVNSKKQRFMNLNELQQELNSIEEQLERLQLDDKSLDNPMDNPEKELLSQNQERLKKQINWLKMQLFHNLNTPISAHYSLQLTPQLLLLDQQQTDIAKKIMEYVQ